MQDVAQRWRTLTMAVMGVGGIEPSDILAESGNAFARDERRALLDDGAVGDICHRVFRADGSVVGGAFDDRIIAIPVTDLRRAQAGGDPWCDGRWMGERPRDGSVDRRATPRGVSRRLREFVDGFAQSLDAGLEAGEHRHIDRGDRGSAGHGCLREHHDIG